MYKILIGIIALAEMLAIAGCGEGYPAHVSATREALLDAADVKYNAAVATAESEYGKAESNARRTLTDAQRDRNLTAADAVLGSAVANAQAARDRSIEEAESYANTAMRRIEFRESEDFAKLLELTGPIGDEGTDIYNLNFHRLFITWMYSTYPDEPISDHWGRTDGQVH